jgi:hypothetical protein
MHASKITTRTRILATLWLWLGLCGWLTAEPISTGLQRDFERPPDSARPWVYWFWLNGNISSNGITADLEAMKRAGIGGVLIMEVDQGAPVGPMAFMSEPWRALFRHVVSEAQRLGLEVNMNNDAGWNGSGGPWIRPEQSMQKVVWTERQITGGQVFADTLAQPQAVAGFYRDIAVVAFPTPGPFRIDNIKAKACYEAAYVAPGIYSNLPPAMVIDRERLVDLTSKMQSDGKLSWEVPAGEWTVMRFGHTSTGVENAPSPASGRGLECDKLSSDGIEANYAGMMSKLISDVGANAGRSLVATHIDSWENGAQNWTVLMRQEFQQRRGYDLQPSLPVFSGRAVESLETSERFLWDLRKTISELVIEKYAGGLRRLAEPHGLRLSIEAYGGPCEDLPYAGQADEPMCEFWMGGGAFNTVKGMASAAHTYGKRILGAESFTAADQEKWLDHPGSIKALGDRAFCEGVNRFVFHRYAMQPWREERRPGMTMGPWGLHYERTQTWWDTSRPWHEYLARCQHLLRQGLFVADLCYLQPEAAPQDFREHANPGYDYDECSAEVVLARMSVDNGRLTLPDGMSYRVLVLPEVRTMTPELIRKLRDLVKAGATIIGPRPLKSPGLTAYPACDDEVNRIAANLWGNCNGSSVQERAFGQGRVIWGPSPEQVLAQDHVKPDFTSRPKLRYIHRRQGDIELYFVANGKTQEVEASCTFRVSGKVPELWWPESGRVEAAPVFEQKDGVTTVSLRLEAAGSVFVVFRPGVQPPAIVELSCDGKVLTPVTARPPRITIRKAIYGVLDDPARTRDVRTVVQQIVNNGEESFRVSQLAQSGDPAPQMVKAVRVEYMVGDQGPITVTGRDTDTVHLPEYGPHITIQKAIYGVPGDAKRTRDVCAKLQRLVDAGEFSFSVARMAEGDDPAFLVVKTLTVDYTVNGQPASIQGTDPDILSLAHPPAEVVDRLAQVQRTEGGKLELEAWKPGHYEVRTSSGQQRSLEVPPLADSVALDGTWQVRFAPGGGAPESVTLEKLIDWSKHSDPGVKYFSGTATYQKAFTISNDWLNAGRRLSLDLGEVAVMATVRLNGKLLGTFWKRPFVLDITDAARPGENSLEVSVVNLWVNRMIGDEQLPEDSERNPDGTLKRWPEWLQAGQPSPTGRFTFTTWRLWKKDSPLQASGLIGPVVLRHSVRMPLAAD